MAGALLMALAVAAQEPQEIKGIVVEEHDSAWYARQAKAWQRICEADPRNEQAWRNLYEALRYQHMGKSGNEVKEIANVLRRMAEAIPDSYIYNRCMYRNACGAPEEAPYALRMAELMPEHPGRDLEDLLCFYWRTGRWDETDGCARRYFDEGVVPAKLLRYNYNQLQGLPEGALFFGRGDAELIPKLMLQAGSGVHRDKVVVPLSFLFNEEYVAALCQKLGIDSVPKSWADFYAGANESVRRQPDALARTYLQSTALQLMRQSGRAAYFTTSVAHEEMRELADNLYSEGLALRYSETPYDNTARLRRNVEEDYTLDYLLEPPLLPEARWQSAELVQTNYITMLAPLTAWYYTQAQAETPADQGLTSRSQQLSRFLLRALERMDIPADMRLSLREYVEKQTPLRKD